MTVGKLVFKRPKGESLLDFLFDHLKYTFGKEWADAQYALPPDERHVVMRWWFSVCELQKASAPNGHEPGQWFKLMPSGDAMEFGSFADDLYRLRLVDALRPKMVNRLRNREEFQGARYECAIAASFVRCGFDIAWESGSDVKCEFVATQRLTGELVAVEVKSRRRTGTLNQPGKLADPQTLRVDVKHLYDKALGQCPSDKPCAIFIDVNLPAPTESTLSEIPWWEDIKALLDQYPEATTSSPAVETCLVFTSFGWHYTGKAKAGDPRSVKVFPGFVRKRLENPNTFIAIIRAIDTYGQIPMLEG